MLSNDSRSPACPIAIVGMSCLFPDARGLNEYWRLIRRREDAVRDVPPSHWHGADYYHSDPKTADHVYCTRGAFLDATDFDPMSYGIPPTTLEAVDTAQLLGLVVAEQALSDAGYQTRLNPSGAKAIDRQKAGVILGVTGALEMVVPLGARLAHPHWKRAMVDCGIDADVAANVAQRIGEKFVGWQENSFPGLLGNVVAGRIANRLDLHGTNCVVDAACASSLSALHMAMLELETGRADVMLTGGIDTFNDIFMFMCFAKTQALSASGDAKPFAADADGTVLGEGVGVLVLKRLADAERDGDKVYAVIRGLGSASDGRAQSIYAPRAEGQARALRNAYAAAGVSPRSVELVEAHGTGTRVGDLVEFDALKSVYADDGGNDKQWAAVGSVKSQIGHTKAAAGVASLIKAVLALRHKVIPPTIKVDLPHPKMELDDSPFYLPTQPRPWFSRAGQPRRAAVSSFGFGGSNFHAVLEEAEADKSEIAWDGSVEIIALSANSRDELIAQAEEWRALLAGQPARAEIARRAAATRDSFDSALRYRLAVVLERDRDGAEAFSQAIVRLRRGDDAAWQMPNVYFGGPESAGKLAFLFPGQGAQYPNMGRDLACAFPDAHRAIGETNAIFGEDELLSDRLYPAPSYSLDAAAHQAARLTETHIAQPALGAVSLAMLRVLEYFGVKPDATAGHSFGEIPALRAAGWIGDEALRLISKVRGALMHAIHRHDEAHESIEEAHAADRGAMVAVEASAADVDRVVAESGGQVQLASRNSNTQSTLCGPREVIHALAGTLSARGWPTKILNVAAAFHSRFMEAAEKKLAEFLKSVEFHPGRVPVYANLTGLHYPDNADEARALLAHQLTHPVLFMDIVRHMYQQGVRTFIEVGPKTTLTNFVKNILPAGSFHAVAVDASGGRSCGVADLARVLAVVAVLGHTVDLKAWEAPPPAAPAENRMTVKLFGANYRADQVARVERATARDPSRNGDLAAPRVSSRAAQPVSAVPLPAHSGMQSSVSIDRPDFPPISPRSAFERPSGTTQVNTHHSNGNGYHSNGDAQAAVYAPPRSNGDDYGVIESVPRDRVVANGRDGLDVPTAVPRATDPQTMQHALALAQEGLRAMQVIQQHTAYAHQKFLEGQETAQRSFQMALQAQQRWLEHALGFSAATGAMPAIEMSPSAAMHPSSNGMIPQPAAPSFFAPPAMPTTVPNGTYAAPVAYAPAATRPVSAAPAARNGDAGGFRPRIDDSPRTAVSQNGHGTNGTNGHAHSHAPVVAQPAVAAPRVAAAPVAAAPGVASGATFEQDLLAVVADLTGYPGDMLKLEMDMEADLGIDSIKRLEILAALQERRPDTRSVDSQYVGSLRTLRDIVEYVTAGEGALAASGK
ncbi:MAG: beta-ketoacyl synthase N-terminal-like domain-containing protein [Phycisphaerae bacterium]|nr:beta-ketoacyl synthase N-terminal-like domain-containing protein [Phycisphaerae bacterium]